MMKTLTTISTVAALIAGLAMASAQTPATTTGPGSVKIKGTQKFCSIGTPNGALNCKYASLDACQKDPKKPKCAPNPTAN